uniref:Treslin_N domain-containing protein n=1 Tax=Syphacia muris TaxID=451379 RepID=A0A0N5AZT5_9BILA
MELNGIRKPRSFEDAAFALVQALSPGKQLNKEHIPFKELRQVINDFVSENRQQLSFLSGIKSPTHVNEKEKFSSSNLDLSDDSSSHISFDDGIVPRTKTHLRYKGGTERVASKASLTKLPKQSRKLMQIRSKRREALQTKDFISFDCAEADLVLKMPSVYKEELSRRSSGVETFFVLLNSLRNFFHHNTWSDNVEELVNGFLEKYIFKKCSDLEVSGDTDCSTGFSNETKLKEYELLVLVELHLIQDRKGFQNLNDTDILNKMRYIYLAGGADRMHKFLTETVTDLFAHMLPELLVKVYSELSMIVPCDLEEYVNQNSNNVEVNSSGKISSSRITARKAAQNERFDRLLKYDSDAEYKPSTSTCTPAENYSSTADSYIETASAKNKKSTISSGHRVVKRKRSFNAKLENIVANTSSPTKLITLHHCSRPCIVPETPEAKVKKRKLITNTEIEDHKKTVKQTPLAKITKAGSKKMNRYSSLLRKTSSRTLLSTSALPESDVHILATSSSSMISPKKFTTRSQAREQFLPSPVYAVTSSLNGGHRNEMRKPSFQEKLAQCSKFSFSDSYSSQQQLICRFILQQEKANDFVVDKEIVDKYRRRLDSIRHSHKKSDKNEVFYGRSARRNNLFEDDCESEDMVGVTTRSSSSTVIQKNRSGRSTISNRVHLAHALLNVHNNNPLSPSKPPKNSPFKLSRMVRPATKSGRRQISKIRIRSNRDKINALLANSSTSVAEPISHASLPES